MFTRAVHDEKRVDLRAALTPKDDDLSPKGIFADFEERLEGREKFARLDENAARGLAFELNRLMLEVKHTPVPADTLREKREIADSLSRAIAALTGAHGATISGILGVEEWVSPYLLHPRGVPPKSPRDAAFDELLCTAFPEEFFANAAISERELEHGLSATRETTEPRQIAFLDACDRAEQELKDRERGERFLPWRGSLIREACIVPLVKRLTALEELARRDARESGAGHARRGKLPSMAREAWEPAYAKKCWEFIRERVGDAAASKMSAADTGDFVTFVRAIAEYASGRKIERGFGGAAKIAVKWGRDEVKREQRIEEIHLTGNAHSIAVTKPPFES